MNLIEAARTQIDALVRAAYDSAAEKGILPAGAELKGSTEIPRDESHGDYACSYAMGAAKALHMAPRKIAEALASEIRLEGSWFDSVEVAGAGFLNFRLGRAWYGQVLKTVEEEGPDYGHGGIRLRQPHRHHDHRQRPGRRSGRRHGLHPG